MATVWNVWVGGSVVLGLIGAVMLVTILWHANSSEEEDILGAIHDLLTVHDELDSSEVLLRMEGDDKVVLFGTVRSEAAKQLVESIAKSVDGVTVDNQLLITRRVEAA